MNGKPHHEPEDIGQAGFTKEQEVEIDRYVKIAMEIEGIPGLVLGISARGRSIFVKGYGLADVEQSIPVDLAMPFLLGSIGKSFVSAAIMMLVEEGRMSLEDSIAVYFKDPPNDWEAIRIKNLLSHTSGIPDRYEDTREIESALDLQAYPISSEEGLVKMIESLPVEFRPGERYSYSNTGYVLLGAIIRKLTGTFYFDFLKERIFDRLGMSSARLAGQDGTLQGAPSGYERDDDGLKKAGPVPYVLNSTADGTIYCNIFDLAKWDAALYERKLLKPSSWDQIFTVFKLNNGRPNEGRYGFGWFIRESNGRRLIEHTGSWDGFMSDISRYADGEFTVMLLCNLDLDYSNMLTRIAHAIAGITMQWPDH